MSEGSGNVVQVVSGSISSLVSQVYGAFNGYPSTTFTSPTQLPDASPAQVILDNYKKYREQYSLVPQDRDEWEAANAGKFAKVKQINPDGLAIPGENKYPIRPFWFKDGKANKSYQVFTTLFEGMGIAEKFMPGAETPVCDNTDFTSVLEKNILIGLKAAGVDVLLIVVPDSVDAARAWAAKKLAAANLTHLMPESLNELDVNQRLELHLSMPRIMIMADKDLSRANELGLVKTDGARLGLTHERAFTLYDRNGVLAGLVKAPDTSLVMCEKFTTGRKMLEMAMGLNLKNEPAPTQSVKSKL